MDEYLTFTYVFILYSFCTDFEWWDRQGSNLRPADYESAATKPPELQSHAYMYSRSTVHILMLAYRVSKSIAHRSIYAKIIVSAVYTRL